MMQSTGPDEWTDPDRGMRHYNPHTPTFVPDAFEGDDTYHDGYICVRCGARKRVLTDEERIATRLLNAQADEEFTITTEKTTVDRTVFDVRTPVGHDKEISLGDPDGAYLHVYVDDTYVWGYEPTDDDASPRLDQNQVTKLIDWQADR